MTTVDTVFNDRGKPVFWEEPVTVHRRLRAKFPENWVRVSVGATGEMVSIPEYLYADKHTDVVKMLVELLRKKDTAAFKRDPDRLRTHIEMTATRLIERIQEK